MVQNKDFNEAQGSVDLNRFFLLMIWELLKRWWINKNISKDLSYKWEATYINHMKDHPICG